MDEKTGTRKKPSAISARPAVRPPGTRGPAASAAVQQGAVQAAVQVPAETEPRADTMQVIDGGGTKSGPNVRSYIERQLKSVYDDVLNQPIPDRFLDLLNALDGPANAGARNAAAGSARKEDAE